MGWTGRWLRGNGGVDCCETQQMGVRPNRVDTRPKPHGLRVERVAGHPCHAAAQAVVAVAVEVTVTPKLHVCACSASVLKTT